MKNLTAAVFGAFLLTVALGQAFNPSLGDSFLGLGGPDDGPGLPEEIYPPQQPIKPK
jgi:hypothetical protein